MKFKFFSLSIFFLFSLLICGCLASAENSEEKNSSTKTSDPVEEILKSMTLEEKVGQMMLVGVHGTTINDDMKNILNQYHYGGIIFYDRNMENKAQVKKLADDLQTVANQKLPLFIALDEEGGRVMRMKHDMPNVPSQQEIANSGDVSNAYSYAQLLAQNLRNIGVNINFAPVADVSNDTRSFSNDPKITADFVSSAAKGYDAENFFYCLKHFPGIGKSKIDPHKNISDIDDDFDTLAIEDLPPFTKVISEQDNSKFMIMSGHLRYTALDDKNPASISPVIVTEILRNKLGFTGVIITDDLQMGATSDYRENIGVKAIQAGADIALVCHEYDTQKKVYQGILEAVQRGEISEERINESVRRILKMKLNIPTN